MRRVLLNPAADILPPILEHGESVASPHLTAMLPAETESPLPDVIIEQQRSVDEDASEDFYDELEIKMKQLYKVLFLQTDDNTEDFINKTVPDYSDDEAVDDIEESNVVILRGDPSADDDDYNMAHTMSKEDDKDAAESQEADQVMRTTSGSGKTIESREETNGTDSDASWATSSESAEKLERFQEKLASIKGKTNWEEIKSNLYESCRVILPSQTFTEKPGTSEDSSSTETQKESEAVTVQAILHKWKPEEHRELEVMRRQTMYSLDDSFRHLRDSANDHGVDYNIRRCSAENEGNELDLNIRRNSIESDRSMINTSAPMEIDSFDLPSRVSSLFKRVSSRISSQFQEVSPVLACKRPASTLSNIPTKKKYMGEKEQITQTEINTCVVSKETGNKKEIQVNILGPLSTANCEIQTDFQGNKETETRTSTVSVDASTQMPEELGRSHRATQTDRAETNDAGTQTRHSFQYYRLFDGINFFFF